MKQLQSKLGLAAIVMLLSIFTTGNAFAGCWDGNGTHYENGEGYRASDGYYYRCEGDRWEGGPTRRLGGCYANGYVYESGTGYTAWNNYYYLCSDGSWYTYAPTN
jgi:hypothetical protein